MLTQKGPRLHTSDIPHLFTVVIPVGFKLVYHLHQLVNQLKTRQIQRINTQHLCRLITWNQYNVRCIIMIIYIWIILHERVKSDPLLFSFRLLSKDLNKCQQTVNFFFCLLQLPFKYINIHQQFSVPSFIYLKGGSYYSKGSL